MECRMCCNMRISWQVSGCYQVIFLTVCRLHLKCDDTRAETRFHFSAKRTSPFKSAGVSVQSTTGSRGVRINDSNAGYTMFRISVKGTVYPFHSPVSPSLPPLRLRVQSHFNLTLHYLFMAILVPQIIHLGSEHRSCSERLGITQQKCLSSMV
jgi:hypothetical protein